MAAGSYEDGNVRSGCRNDSKRLHQLSNYELIKKDLLQGVRQWYGLNICLIGNKEYVRSPGYQVAWATKFYMVVQNIVGVLGIELAYCHLSGAKKFEVAARFLENLWTP
jgi:hypothetical protein